MRDSATSGQPPVNNYSKETGHVMDVGIRLVFCSCASSIGSLCLRGEPQISDEDRRMPSDKHQAGRAVTHKMVIVMETRTQHTRDRGIRAIGWLGGLVGGLLFAGLGLELLAHQTFGPTDVATLLLAIYLATWFSVLGVAGFLILSIAWLLRRGPRMAETAALEEPESIQPAVVSDAPSKLPGMMIA
jgi:hypothetical protein